MKTLATISMALVFGTLTLAASTASAHGKNHPSCNSSHHHNNSGCCDSGCHHKPCDPCQGCGKCGGGGVVVSEPVSPPKTPVRPIINRFPVTTIFGQPAPTKKPGGLIGRFGGQTISQFGGLKGTTTTKGSGLASTLLNGLGHSAEGLGNVVVNGVEDAVNSLTSWL